MLDAVEGGEPDRDIIESVIVDHSTGIRVLLAPPSPEGADLVTPAYLRKIVEMLRENHDWVVVDLPSGLNDHTLGVLDAAAVATEAAGALLPDAPLPVGMKHCKQGHAYPATRAECPHCARARKRRHRQLKAQKRTG